MGRNLDYARMLIFCLRYRPLTSVVSRLRPDSASPRRARLFDRLRSVPRYLARTHRLGCPPSAKFSCHAFHEWLPKDGAPNRETDESWYSGCGCQPFVNLLIVFTATKDDTSNLVPAISACGDHYFLAIFAPVESFNLPNVCLNSGTLELLNSFNHRPWPNLQVIDFLVSADTIELRFLCRYQ
jgi:hypothetical protein